MNFWNIQLYLSLFLSFLLIHLFITLKKLVFAELFWSLLHLHFHFWSLNQNFFNFLSSEYYLLLHHCLHFPYRLILINHLSRHFLRLWWIFCHENFNIFLLFHHHHFSSLLTHKLIDSFIKLFIFNVHLLFKLSKALFLSFSLPFSFLAILLLLYY